MGKQSVVLSQLIDREIEAITKAKNVTTKVGCIHKEYETEKKTDAEDKKGQEEDDEAFIVKTVKEQYDEIAGEVEVDVKVLEEMSSEDSSIFDTTGTASDLPDERWDEDGPAVIIGMNHGGTPPPLCKDLDKFYGKMATTSVTTERQVFIPWLDNYLPVTALGRGLGPSLKNTLFIIGAIRFMLFFVHLKCLINLQTGVSEDKYDCENCLVHIVTFQIISTNLDLLICFGIFNGLIGSKSILISSTVIFHLLAFFLSMMAFDHSLRLMRHSNLTLEASFFFINGLSYLMFGFFVFSFWWRLRHKPSSLKPRRKFRMSQDGDKLR